MGKLYRNLNDGSVWLFAEKFGPWLVFVNPENPKQRYHITAEFSRNYALLEVH